MPRSAYTDVMPGTKRARLLHALTTTGLTNKEADELTGTRSSLEAVLQSFEDEKGYDVRTVPLPVGHPRRQNRERLVYVIVGRHDWRHRKYESYVDPARLALRLREETAPCSTTAQT